MARSTKREKRRSRFESMVVRLLHEHRGDPSWTPERARAVAAQICFKAHGKKACERRAARARRAGKRHHEVLGR